MISVPPLRGLVSGVNLGPTPFTASNPYDNFAAYTTSSLLNNGNYGWNWQGNKWAAVNILPTLNGLDDMESYVHSASLSGSNGGVGQWGDAYFSI